MIRDNSKFVWEGLTFQIVQSVHIMNGYAIVPTYGLMITEPSSNKKIFFTGDSQFNPNQIIDFYNEADFIIQDCETAPYKSGVHAHFDELCTLSGDIKKKMCLVHYQDNVLSNLPSTINLEWEAKVKKSNFNKCGLVTKGTVLTSEDIFNGK
jgi:ribonuclease BN (tRNA processing enzyme)